MIKLLSKLMREGNIIVELWRHIMMLLWRHNYFLIMLDIMSIGRGNMMVEFFSAEILVSVCRYLSCIEFGDSLITSAASFSFLDAFISPSAAITCCDVIMSAFYNSLKLSLKGIRNEKFRDNQFKVAIAWKGLKILINFGNIWLLIILLKK